MEHHELALKIRLSPKEQEQVAVVAVNCLVNLRDILFSNKPKRAEGFTEFEKILAVTGMLGKILEMAVEKFDKKEY